MLSAVSEVRLVPVAVMGGAQARQLVDVAPERPKPIRRSQLEIVFWFSCVAGLIELAEQAAVDVSCRRDQFGHVSELEPPIVDLTHDGVDLTIRLVEWRGGRRRAANAGASL